MSKVILSTSQQKKFPEVLLVQQNKRWSFIEWYVVTKTEWTKKRAQEFQESFGKSVNPYGFYEFDSVYDKTRLNYVYTWECSANS